MSASTFCSSERHSCWSAMDTASGTVFTRIVTVVSEALIDEVGSLSISSAIRQSSSVSGS